MLKTITSLYHNTLLSIKTELIYVLQEGKLGAAYYLVSEDYTIKNKYVDDYKYFVFALKEKYGKPRFAKTLWFDNLSKNDHSNRGFVYARGNAASLTEWKQGDTIIDVFLLGKDQQIYLGIWYSNKSVDE